MSMTAWLAAAAAAALAGMLPQQAVIEAPGPEGALQGTLLMPQQGSGDIVLIIPGSGPTDRDGNNPLGIRAASYRLLAEALAERGIASVRIDKRGMFGSRAAVADPNAVTIGDYAADVRAWVQAAQARTGARCIWLAGHSEGGLVALAAAHQPDGICGLILLAAPGRRVGEALREQLRSNPANAPILDQALAALDRLEAGERVDAATLHPALLTLFAPQVQGYLIDLLAQDPAALLSRYEGPVLIVHGQRDLQVAEADARRLAEASPNARLVLLPDVNHTLKRVESDDRAANLATYADPDLPIAPQVVEAVAQFVRERR